MRRARHLLIGLTLATLACEPPSDVAPDATRLDPAPQTAAPEDDRAEPILYERIGAGEEVSVIVLLRAPSDGRIEAALTGREARVERRYDRLPLLAVTVGSERALRAAARHPDTLLVVPDVPHEAYLTQSLGLVSQPAAAVAGKTGAGATVAVIDTGVRYTLPAFGSCTAPGTPASCKVSVAQDFATADGLLDDASGHGTNVAAIVAGVAPDAKIAALDVFRADGKAWSSDILAAIDWVIANKATYGIEAMNMSLGAGEFTAPCPADALAIGLATARAAGILTAAATGNRGLLNRFASPACAPAAVSVGAVYDAGIGGMSWSTCTDATTAADKVTCFSDSASFLTMLAPGALITAAGSTFGGTSQASPHVAGALAVLRAAFPAESLDETVARLTGNGTLVTDPRNGVITPRLNLAAAATDCVTSVTPLTATQPYFGGTVTLALTAPDACAWTAGSNVAWMTLATDASGTGSATVTFTTAANFGAARTGTVSVGGRSVAVTQWSDLIAPTGTVSIDGGAAATRLTATTLTLTASDFSGVTSMCLSATATCTAWMAYAESAAWTLAGGDGTKSVTATFKDAAGNTVTATDSIVLDTTRPVNGTLAATPVGGSVALSWPGFTDTLSGIASYTVVAAAGAAPVSCAVGTLVYSGTATVATHTGLTDGVAMGYRVCATDGAGNVSTGAVATATPAPEQTPPTGAVVINGGAAMTSSAAVTLTLAATDASGVASMCVSNGASCAAFVPFAPAMAWTLASGSGAKAVRAWFKDAWGNVSSPVSDAITLDAVPPTNGSIVAAPSNGAIALTWSGFSDATSAVVSYTLVAAPNTAPATCASGAVLATGAVAAFTHTGLANGAVWGYRVCAVDAAGNVSSGAAVTATSAPELDPPIGTVTIAAGAAVVGSAFVTLTLTASDASAVTAMCVSNGPTCSAWQPFATTLAWKLLAHSGVKNVSAWFRDVWGNASSVAAIDTIALDVTAPTGGSLIATGSSGKVTLSWSGFSDASSGVASYKLAGGLTEPTSCAAGTLLQTGAGTSFTHTGLTNGVARFYRLCAFDAVGNSTSGLTAKAIPAPEYVAPTGTLTINGGAAATALTAVTLAISATDASGVAKMCVSNGLTCWAWEPYATSRAWKLPATNGVRTVRVFFEDAWGNVSAGVTDTIVLDNGPPSNGKLIPTALPGAVKLVWSGFSDEITSVVSYLVVSGIELPPACTSVAPVYSGAATTFTATGLAAGVPLYFRVCAVDAAGNLSTGTRVKVTPL